MVHYIDGYYVHPLLMDLSFLTTLWFERLKFQINTLILEIIIYKQFLVKRDERLIENILDMSVKYC